MKRHLQAETAELHAKLDHIIEHHPDIPPYVSKNAPRNRRLQQELARGVEITGSRGHIDGVLAQGFERNDIKSAFVR